MGMGDQRHVPAAVPPEILSTQYVGSWVGTRTGLNECGKSGPYRDSIPETSGS